VYVTVARADAPGARLLARDPHDGRVRWWRDLPGVPRLHPAGKLLLAGVPGRLTALRAGSGEEAWVHRMAEDPSWSVTVADGRLVLGNALGRQGLRLRNGELLWAWSRTATGFSAAGPARVPEQAGPGFADGLVHVLDGETVRAVRRRTGEEVWRFNLGVPAPRLLVEGGVVYAAAYREEQGADLVFALDARGGTTCSGPGRACCTCGPPRAVGAGC
jgi:outer membrane protein assembly factor BamB